MQKIDISNFKDKKIALVLSGGVVKAASWHLGVALALDELGFTFKHNGSGPKKPFEISTYVGSSAGSLINLYFASGLKPIDVIEASINKNSPKVKPVTYEDMLSIKRPPHKPTRGNLHDTLDGFPFFAKRLLKPILEMSGLFTTQGLYDYIQDQVLKVQTFEEMAADFFVVATQLDHSRKVIFSKYNYPSESHDDTSVYYTGIPVADSVSASMSVPPFYSPYPIKNPLTNQIDYYIDGEIRETLSTHVAIDNKCDIVISSWTHTPYHYHGEVGSLINYGLPAICLQSIYLMIQKKIVSARAYRSNAKDIIDTVGEYMDSQNFEKKHRQKILGILERKLNYTRDVKLIDIYPDHNDYKTFFNNSFSLNPDNLSYLVTAAFKKTIEVFRALEWS